MNTTCAMGVSIVSNRAEQPSHTYEITKSGGDGRASDNLEHGPFVQLAVPAINGHLGVQFDQERAQQALAAG
jgi:hypothetical protein